MKSELLKEKLKLYLICGEGEDPGALPGKVEQALAGGVTAVQLRVKSWTSRDFFMAALDISKITKQSDALFFVNDRLDIAMACGADGVHLGQEDLPVKEARKICGPNLLIGATARTPEPALKAERDGADYIGCGSAFQTTTKKDAQVIGPQGIKLVAGALSIPCVAIGGITADNVSDLAMCGCYGIALSAAVISSENPKNQAEKIVKKLNLVLK